MSPAVKTHWQPRFKFITKFFIFLLILTTNFVWTAELPNIPETELEAELWLFAGLINYDLWNKIEPYYTEKISVQDNELEIIQSLFPQNLNTIPEKNILKNYSPWKQKDIEKFFKDYPHLENLKPILTFQKTECRTKVNINSKLKENFGSNLFNLKGSTIFKSYLKVEFHTNYQDSILRLRRRTISITPNENTLISLGNFSFNIDNGLLWGYTPYSSLIQERALDNWLYPNNNRWNGLKIEQKLFSNTISFITHKTKNELVSILGLKSNLDKNTLNTSLHINSTDSNNLSISAYINISQNIGKSSLSLSSLINSDSYKTIPLQFQLQSTFQKVRHLLDVTYLPRSYKIDKSYTYHFFSNKLGTNPTDKSDALQINNSLNIKFNNKLNQKLSSIFLFNSASYYLRNNLEFSYRSTISPTLKVTVDKHNDFLRVYIRLRSKIDFKRNLIISPLFTAYLNDSDYYRFSWQLSSINKLKKSQIQTLIRYSINSKNEKEIIFKIFSTLIFSNRSYGKYIFTFKPFEKSNNKFEIYLGQSFNL